MKSRHPINIDLNNLFQPALSNGLKSISDFETEFHQIHDGIKALKQMGNLPFSKLPNDEVMLQEILEVAGRYDGFDNVIAFGIGGSALGTSSIYHAVGGAYENLLSATKKSEHPRLFVVDHIEPKTISDLFDFIRSDKNFFVFVSKSGNTAETLAQFLFVKNHVKKLGADNCLVITDSKDGCLGNMAHQKKIPTLYIPNGVGGRFSVFTPVGLFPLAMCGVDIAALLDGAAHVEELCQHDVLAQNPAGLLAMSLHAWTQKKNISQIVMMPYSDRLRYFSDYFAQIWAESLGKKMTLDGKEKFIGSTALKSVGVTDQHSQLQLYLEGPTDKLVLFIEVDDSDVEGQLSDQKEGDERVDFLCGSTLHELMNSEKAATEESLREAYCPNATIKVSMVNEFQLGQLYQLTMNVIPYMGALLNINAFDQPAVERIKKFTFGIMGRKGFEDFALKVKGIKKRKDLIF